MSDGGRSDRANSWDPSDLKRWCWGCWYYYGMIEFNMFLGFCFKTDRRTDEQTYAIVESLSWLKKSVKMVATVFTNGYLISFSNFSFQLVQIAHVPSPGSRAITNLPGPGTNNSSTLQWSSVAWVWEISWKLQWWKRCQVWKCLKKYH